MVFAVIYGILQANTKYTTFFTKLGKVCHKRLPTGFGCLLFFALLAPVMARLLRFMCLDDQVVMAQVSHPIPFRTRP